jgi:hypothetical protein
VAGFFFLPGLKGRFLLPKNGAAYAEHHRERRNDVSIVNLTVLKVNGKWTVRLQDKRGIQYLGATPSRGAIEAFCARLMADIMTAGDQVNLKVEPDRSARRFRMPRRAALAPPLEEFDNRLDP